MKKPKILFTLLLVTNACGSLNPQQSGTEPISHEAFTELLSVHVDGEGMVDYAGFSNDRTKLEAYLELLSENAPNDSNWSRNDKIAYWINSYNAFTIKLILEHYPIESIKDIGSTITIPFVNSPWDIKFIEIAGKQYDLNNIEHNILRKLWDEPRIHFAINCASMSCPKLLRQAYKGSKLDSQLEQSAFNFINDDFRNEITSGGVEVSKIFSWFEGDFTEKTSLREYLNQYSEIKIDNETDINFKDYDWSLNVQE